MTQLLGAVKPRALAVMVSGGSDSMALLLLARDWAVAHDLGLVAVTVDHGLRTESASEADWVAGQAAAMGVSHVTLPWTGWSGQGNLQAAARAARYALVQDWRRRVQPDIDAILVGHTQDDQAETMLMRLARGSGVDGLAGMKAAPVEPAEALKAGSAPLLRPLLWADRQALRDHLQAAGFAWVEDPSNDNDKFQRVKARKALAELSELGITVEGLAKTATHMGRAQKALAIRASQVASSAVTEVLPGVLSFSLPALAEIEEETQLRLLAHGLQCISSAPYRPRLASLELALADALGGKGSTLHGGQIFPHKDRLLVVREFNAVAAMEAPADGQSFWDRRWRVKGQRLNGVTIRPLGEEGAARIETSHGLPKPVLHSFPALWSGNTLIAAPHLLHIALCQAQYAASAEFHRSILSH